MKWFGALLTCLLLFSCLREKAEYKSINRQIDYKLHQFGEGNPIIDYSYLSVALTITDTLNDTLHYVPKYQYFIELKNRSVDSAWKQFHIGDSLSLRLPRKEVNKYFKFYQLLQSDSGVVLMHSRIKSAYHSEQEAETAIRDVLSKKELYEQAELRRYLKQHSNRLDTINGVYRILEKRDSLSDAYIKFGSEVSLHYKGRFIDGYVFDNTYKKGISPTFIYGQDYQLIEGMHSGLRGCKEGDSIKIIVPSRRGFGEEGSLAGIVPPYTAVIFDVNIIKVIN